jgi:hypothetical protein
MTRKREHYKNMTREFSERFDSKRLFFRQMRSWVYLPLYSMLFVPSVAGANDLDKLARQGFAVVEQTWVDGDYEGCEFNRILPFEDGLALRCTSYSYHYSYHPEVLIMQHFTSKAVRVLIDDEEVTGTVVRMPTLPPGFKLDKPL